jgi:hypothetical protein
MSSRVTFPTPRSARKCEGMNPHTFTLGVGIPMDSQIFRGQLQGLKFIELNFFLYHWKPLGTYMFKLSLHDPFGFLKHKLWLKERLGIKLPIWLPTIKSRESPQFLCVQVACHILLERFWQGLKLCFRPHFNQRSTHKVMGFKSCESPNLGISRFLFESLETKWHLDVGLVARHRKYYKRKVVASPKSEPW